MSHFDLQTPEGKEAFKKHCEEWEDSQDWEGYQRQQPHMSTTAHWVLRILALIVIGILVYTSSR